MTSTSLKLAAAGLSGLLALGTLSACGSDKDDAAQSTTAHATDSSRLPGHTDDTENTTKNDSKKNDSGAESNTAEDKDAAQPGGNDGDNSGNNGADNNADKPADNNAAPDNAGSDNGADNNAAPQINVNPDPHVAPAQPLNTGEEQSPDSQIGRDIHGLVSGVYAANTLHDMLTYVPNNTCNATLDRTGGRMSDEDLAQIPDMPLDSFNADLKNITVKSISNLRVDGNQASADITVTTPHGDETNTQRFLNEDGRWKFCGEN